ncbi:MAG TPA: MerR family transcriptional regulator [Burkholderiales bacterium]|nr:MerR family transcriptional regulator [Burkholderiales bacterium]
MEQNSVLTGQILDQFKLDLNEFAHACCVPPQWIVERVAEGLLLDESPADLNTLRFSSYALIRARRMLNIERNFDANPELAALVVDLIEQLERFRSKLNPAGISR